MLLVDKQIIKYYLRNKIGIHPFNLFNVQPNSYDIRLDTQFITFDAGQKIDTSNPSTFKQGCIYEEHLESITLKPHQFILGQTYESIVLPNNIVGKIEGKSSLARLGISIHQTGGWIDAGFNGTITLEIYNASDNEITLYPLDKIGQIVFFKTKRCKNPYGSEGNNNHYQNQSKPRLSEFQHEIY